MPKPGATGLTRIRHATVYSIQGLRAAWQHESAFRQETLLIAVLLPFAFFLGRHATEVALLITVLGIVLITELLNSAIEAVVDRVSSEQHELAGRAKDMGSAAVAISLLLAAIVWSLVALDRLTA
ncbi:MAG: diacylglycerol kinase [Proteobacteria bacterium]|nr:diacylglycerol kinase [Pseudomonadota bacterium]